MTSTTKTCCLAIVLAALAGPAEAHDDPPGCSFNSPTIALTVHRGDGIAGVSGGVSECEHIVYRAELTKASSSQYCAFSEGQFTVTTPDGVVHEVSGDVPCIGGTSGEGCDPTITTLIATIPYTVDPADVVGNLLTASATYKNGIGHDADGNTAGLFISTPRSTAVIPCGDNDLCTIDVCDPNLGGSAACITTPVVCNDDSLCTTEQCNPATGQCDFSPISCNDNDLCTIEGCDPATGCVITPVVCTDNSVCTTDACSPVSGQCVFTPITCDDDDLCTIDSCDPVTGCQVAPILCGDNDLCTTDGCNPLTGDCQFTPSVVCNDGSVCSDDACDPTTGLCVYTPVPQGTPCRASAGVCDLAEVCTGGDTACPTDAFASSTTVCRPAADVCDVAEECTGSHADCPSDAPRPSGFACRSAAGPCDVVDRCDGASVACPADGKLPDGATCSDDAFCNGADTCVGGQCTGHAGNPCPGPDGDGDCAESCNAAAKNCSAPDPAGASCDDGDPCTVTDTCQAGACESGAPTECDVGELCNPTTGECVPSEIPCANACDDENGCTTDACDTSVGQCTNVAVADGQACNDGDECTSGDSCVAGACGGRDCDSDVRQVVENGVPQPQVEVVCRILARKPNGKPRGGRCSATLLDATGRATVGIVVAMPLKKKPLSAKGKAPIRNGTVTLNLELNELGEQLLGNSPDGQLQVEANGKIEINGKKPAGSRKVRKISKTIVLRRQ